MKRDKKVLSIQEACDAMDNRMVSFKRMIHAFTDFEVGLFAGLIMKEMDRRNKINEKAEKEAAHALNEESGSHSSDVVFLADSAALDALCEKVREETGQSNDV